jgi:hypothetical protein
LLGSPVGFVGESIDSPTAIGELHFCRTACRRPLAAMWGDERIGGETKFSYSPGSCTAASLATSPTSTQFVSPMSHAAPKPATRPHRPAGPQRAEPLTNDRQKLITLDTMEIGAFVV